MDELNQIIANNLIHFRKSAGLTQGQLAEKLCYSDKSVSKWERGEAIPDVVVLKKLADLYDITIDTLISPNAKKRKFGRAFLPFLRQKHTLISLMAIGLVWVVATFVFAVLGMIFPNATGLWKIFVVALPVSFVVAIVFSEMWGKNLVRAISIIGFVWSLAITLFFALNITNNWLFFIIPVPITILVGVWFGFRNRFLNKLKQL